MQGNSIQSFFCVFFHLDYKIVAFYMTSSYTLHFGSLSSLHPHLDSCPSHSFLSIPTLYYFSPLKESSMPPPQYQGFMCTPCQTNTTNISKIVFKSRQRFLVHTQRKKLNIFSNNISNLFRDLKFEWMYLNMRYCGLLFHISQFVITFQNNPDNQEMQFVMFIKLNLRLCSP